MMPIHERPERAEVRGSPHRQSAVFDSTTVSRPQIDTSVERSGWWWAQSGRVLAPGGIACGRVRLWRRRRRRRREEVTRSQPANLQPTPAPNPLPYLLTPLLPPPAPRGSIPQLGSSVFGQPPVWFNVWGEGGPGRRVGRCPEMRSSRLSMHMATQGPAAVARSLFPAWWGRVGPHMGLGAGRAPTLQRGHSGLQRLYDSGAGPTSL